MSDYVPTTEQVKRAYVEGVEHDCYYEGDVTITHDGIYEANRFNAWLTEYTRVKQAEAWERAWREIRSIPRWWNTEDQYGEFDMQPLGPNETTEQGAYMAVREVMTNNPYRKGERR